MLLERTVSQSVGSTPDEVRGPSRVDLGVRDLGTPLCERYVIAGAQGALLTNSEHILTAARNSFRQATAPCADPDLTLRLWIDATARGQPPWPEAHFRGLAHLVYAGFDPENSLLLDLRRRHVIGRFSPAMACDAGYWLRVIFPTALGLVSEALGLTALHCACADWDGKGLLLAGDSGSGKSTLALALAQNGFALLSDDWTYFSRAARELRAWGIVSPVKLLPDAGRYFPELQRYTPELSLNGERAYEVDPEAVFGVRRSLRCKPHWLIFLERQHRSGHRFVRVTPQETVERLQFDLEDLPPELAHVRREQSETILDLAGRECWTLRHNESPGDLARILTRFCRDSRMASSSFSDPDHEAHRQPGVHHPLIESYQSVRTGPDIIRRFVPTPLVTNLRARSYTTRLETNSPAILQQVQDSLRLEASAQPSKGQFVWKLIGEADGRQPSTWPTVSAFGADGLRLESLDQRNFFAMDSSARIAIGFVATSLVNDAPAFRKLFLDRLISATADAADGST